MEREVHDNIDRQERVDESERANFQHFLGQLTALLDLREPNGLRGIPMRTSAASKFLGPSKKRGRSRLSTGGCAARIRSWGAPFVISVALLVVSVPSESNAATWRVAQDGSGDFDNLIAVSDAVASGDTVFVAAGVYDSTISFVGAAGTWLTSFPVRVAELTIIGESQSGVLIGPLQPVPLIANDPHSISGGTSSVRTNVSNLTLRNAVVGINTPAGGRIEGVRFLSNEYGVLDNGATELQVVNCVFDLNIFGYIGFDALRPSIVDCAFSGGSGFNIAVEFIGSEDASVVNCVFPAGRQALQFEQGSTGGVVRACRFGILESASVRVVSFSSVVVTDCNIPGSLWGVPIELERFSSLAISRSLIGEGLAGWSIDARSPVTLSVNQCDVLPGNGYAIKLATGAVESCVIDMTSSYWGTSDPEQIRELIWDANDDASTMATVLYEPFAQSSVANEVHSIGNLKSRFRQK